MNLKKLKFKKGEGVESVWYISEEQYSALINYAINDLMKKGMAAELEIDPEALLEELKQTDEEKYTELLQMLDSENLHQA